MLANKRLKAEAACAVSRASRNIARASRHVARMSRKRQAIISEAKLWRNVLTRQPSPAFTQCCPRCIAHGQAVAKVFLTSRRKSHAASYVGDCCRLARVRAETAQRSYVEIRHREAGFMAFGDIASICWAASGEHVERAISLSRYLGICRGSVRIMWRLRPMLVWHALACRPP